MSLQSSKNNEPNTLTLLFFLYPQSPAVAVNKEIFKEYGWRSFA